MQSIISSVTVLDFEPDVKPFAAYSFGLVATYMDSF